MLSNAYFLAKFRFDTAENEPTKKLQNLKTSLQNLLIVLTPPEGHSPRGDPPALRRIAEVLPDLREHVDDEVSFRTGELLLQHDVVDLRLV